MYINNKSHTKHTSTPNPNPYVLANQTLTPFSTISEGDNETEKLTDNMTEKMTDNETEKIIETETEILVTMFSFRLADSELDKIVITIMIAS